MSSVGERGGAEEQRSSSENTVQEESRLFSGPRIRVDLFGGRKPKGQEPNGDWSSVSAAQAVPHRLLPPSRLHSVPPKQRPEGGGVVAERERNRPNGLGLEWKHDPTTRSWTTTVTGEKQEKSDYRLQKGKTSPNGLWLGGMCCNRYPHTLQEGYKRGFPFQDRCLVHPNTSPLTGPSIKPFNWESFGMEPYWFSSNNQLCQRVAVFQAEGGPSFVPLRVLLPFSLEETAAPAESKGEGGGGVLQWCGEERSQTKTQRENFLKSGCQMLQQSIDICPDDFRRVGTVVGRRFSLINIQSFQEFFLKTKIDSLLQNLAVSKRSQSLPGFCVCDAIDTRDT